MEVRQQEGLPARQQEGEEAQLPLPTLGDPGPLCWGWGRRGRGLGLSSWVISPGSQVLGEGPAGLRNQRKVTGAVLTCRRGADGPRGPGLWVGGEVKSHQMIKK